MNTAAYLRRDKILCKGSFKFFQPHFPINLLLSKTCFYTEVAITFKIKENLNNFSGYAIGRKKEMAESHVPWAYFS